MNNQNKLEAWHDSHTFTYSFTPEANYVHGQCDETRDPRRNPFKHGGNI